MKKIFLKNKARIIITMLLCILSSFVNVLSGYLLSYLFQGISQNSIEVFYSSIILVIAVWVLAILSSYIKGIFQSKTVSKMNNTLRELIADKITNLNYSEYYELDTGNYISWLTNDVNQINSLCFNKIFFIVESIFAFIFAFIALLSFHYIIAVVALVLSIFMFIIPKFTNKYISKYIEKTSLGQEAFVENVKESIMGYDVYINFNLLNNMKEKIITYSINLEKILYTLNKKQLSLQTIISLSNLVSQLSLLFITVLLVIKNLTPDGAVLSITNLGGVFFSSLVNILNGIVALKSSFVLFNKFDYIKDNKKMPYSIDEIENIEIKGLHFKYDENIILENINMGFEKGKKYAIIGESGSGKTTLTKIILGHVDNYSGDILINGIDKKLINKNSINNSISYIGQHIYLFNDTMKNNITLGRDYSNDEIQDAIHNSNLTNLISSSKNNLNFEILENGKNLSGGQKQRVAIARALIYNKSFLIIDEGTSSLDEKNALEIESLMVNNPNLTIILITHNLNDEISQKLDKIYYI